MELPRILPSAGFDDKETILFCTSLLMDVIPVAADFSFGILWQDPGDIWAAGRPSPAS